MNPRAADACRCQRVVSVEMKSLPYPAQGPDSRGWQVGNNAKVEPKNVVKFVNQQKISPLLPVKMKSPFEKLSP